MNVLSHKRYFPYLCIVLFLINNVMLCINKVNGDFIDHLFHGYLYTSLMLAVTFTCIYACYHIKKRWFDIRDDFKEDKEYVFTVGVLLLVLFIVELFPYNDIIQFFFPYMVRLLLLIGYVLPVLYECYMLNRNMYKSYMYGMIILYVLTILLSISRLSPIYIGVSILLLFTSFMLSTYHYNRVLLSNKWFIVSSVIVMIHVMVGMIYLTEGNYIVERIHEYIVPQLDTGYHYIRELLSHSKFIGKSDYINKIMLEEFDVYQLIGSSLLYRCGWLVFFLYLVLHYTLIRILISLMKQYIKDKNILLVIFMLYVCIQLVCSITGALGLPILNILSPLTDIKSDLFIIIVIICISDILEDSFDEVNP